MKMLLAILPLFLALGSFGQGLTLRDPTYAPSFRPVVASGPVAPTLIITTNSDFNDTTATETVPSISWNTDDWIFIIGMTADPTITLATPTVSGLTFALVTNNVGASSDTLFYLWRAVAGSSSSGSITMTTSSGSNIKGLAVWVYRGTDGIGNLVRFTPGATNKTYSLTRAYDHSAVILGLADWSAVNDQSVNPWPTTDGFIEKIGYNSGNYTTFTCYWLDQGNAGSRPYGITNHVGVADFSGLAVEVRGH
jgi:hypothetical protein